MRIAVLYMNNQFGLIVKVFLLSALISTLIKYLIPSLAIMSGDTILPKAIDVGWKDVILSPGMANTIALIMVLSPTVIVAALLIGRIALAKRS
jgi:hypothetical protein